MSSGAVWAYILVFLLLGPEMSEEERAERAVEAQEFETLRKSGSSLAQIGEARARARFEGKSLDDEDDKASSEHEKREEVHAV